MRKAALYHTQNPNAATAMPATINGIFEKGTFEKSNMPATDTVIPITVAKMSIAP